MKLCKSFFLGVLFLGITINIAQAVGPMWLTSACYKFRLAVWDKFDDKEFTVKYIVTSKRGEMYIAEKKPPIQLPQKFFSLITLRMQIMDYKLMLTAMKVKSIHGKFIQIMYCAIAEQYLSNVI